MDQMEPKGGACTQLTLLLSVTVLPSPVHKFKQTNHVRAQVCWRHSVQLYPDATAVLPLAIIANSPSATAQAARGNGTRTLILRFRHKRHSRRGCCDARLDSTQHTASACLYNHGAPTPASFVRTPYPTPTSDHTITPTTKQKGCRQQTK